MASIQSKTGKSGKKSYYVVISNQGRHKWIKAGSLRNAKAMKREIESLEESKRVEKLGLTDKVVRIDDFFEQYAQHIEIRTSPGTVKRYLSVLNTFITFLKMFHPNIKALHEISRDIIESYQNKRLRSVELKIAADGTKPGVHSKKRLPLPQTVNNEVTMLAIAFNWAHKRGLIQAVPTRSIDRLKSDPQREVRILSKDECGQLLKAAKEVARLDSRLRIYGKIFKFLLNTGLRSGELCNLTWEDIDLETKLLKIRPKAGWTPKTAARQFYINDLSIKVLKSIPENDAYVFASENGKQLSTDDIRRVLIKTAKLAGLKGFTRVHDLRHTFSSLMQMNGVDRGTVATILGHKDLSTTLIYTHQTEAHLKKCIEKVEIK